MRELVFHVGTPKTGSSAMQVFFARNHEALKGRNLEYFRIGDFTLGMAGNISSGNGSLVSRVLLPQGNPIGIADGAPHIGALLNAIDASACGRGLVSSEIFADAEPAKLAELLDQLRRKGITPKAFFYVRRQDQFLSSAYMQQVKRHQCVELPETYIRRVYREIGYLRYHSFFKATETLFGAGNVMVRVYEKATAGQDGLFTAFLHAIGVDPAGLDYRVSDVNTSLTPRTLAMMLMLNRYRPRMQFSDALVENEILSGAAHSGVRHCLFGDALRAEIEAYFAEENAALAGDYFMRRDLFDPAEPSGAAPSLADMALTAEDAVGFLGSLLVRLDERVAALETLLRATGGGD